MLFSYVGCILILLAISFIWVRPIYLSILLLSVFMLVTQYHIHSKSLFYINDPTIPTYSIEQLHNELKHGDIINNNYYKYNPTLFLFKYFNYRLSHFAIIIEENNMKYVIESSGDRVGHYKKDIIYTIPNVNNGDTWYIYKQPLLKWLYSNPKQIIRIFRQPNNNIKIKVTNYDLTHPHILTFPIIGKCYYCTIIIGTILAKNKVINACSRLAPYRSNELVTLLLQAKYTSFLCIVK